jgi:hypothetical protein
MPNNSHLVKINQIAITYAPNQWNLPVVDPPLYVPIEEYDPNWKDEIITPIEICW